jgi:glycosyltransferase involved in cell wall biosynthesis
MVPGRRLSVVQVLPALESGGVERGTLEVARHLVDNGHRSIVISAGGRLVRRLLAEGSEHIQLDVGRKSLLSLRLVPRLRALFAGLDIVHMRSRLPAWLCYLAWRGMDPARRPHLVSTVHGPYSVNAYSAVMTRGERVIVISEMIRDYVLRHYPRVDPAKLRLIYRGVDPEVFAYGRKPDPAWLDAWQGDFPETRGKRLLTLPARLTRWKGQEDFIELIARLKPRHPDIHGLLVGDTHPRRRQFQEELRGRVAALGLEGDISFTGHRGDVAEIMAASHLVYSLSREPEAFGRVSLEALSLGVPVIAYDHGGVGEQLRAILPEGAVPTGDVAAAAALTERWLAQPPVVPREQPFTLARMLDATLAVYRELADPARG